VCVCACVSKGHKVQSSLSSSNNLLFTNYLKGRGRQESFHKFTCNRRIENKKMNNTVGESVESRIEHLRLQGSVIDSREIYIDGIPVAESGSFISKHYFNCIPNNSLATAPLMKKFLEETKDNQSKPSEVHPQSPKQILKLIRDFSELPPILSPLKVLSKEEVEVLLSKQKQLENSKNRNEVFEQVTVVKPVSALQSVNDTKEDHLDAFGSEEEEESCPISYTIPVPAKKPSPEVAQAPPDSRKTVKIIPKKPKVSPDEPVSSTIQEATPISSNIPPNNNLLSTPYQKEEKKKESSDKHTEYQEAKNVQSRKEESAKTTEIKSKDNSKDELPNVKRKLESSSSTNKKSSPSVEKDSKPSEQESLKKRMDHSPTTSAKNSDSNSRNRSSSSSTSRRDDNRKEQDRKREEKYEHNRERDSNKIKDRDNRSREYSERSRDDSRIREGKDNRSRADRDNRGRDNRNTSDRDQSYINSSRPSRYNNRESVERERSSHRISSRKSPTERISRDRSEDKEKKEREYSTKDSASDAQSPYKDRKRGRECQKEDDNNRKKPKIEEANKPSGIHSSNISTLNWKQLLRLATDRKHEGDSYAEVGMQNKLYVDASIMFLQAALKAEGEAQTKAISIYRTTYEFLKQNIGRLENHSRRTKDLQTRINLYYLGCAICAYKLFMLKKDELRVSHNNVVEQLTGKKRTPEPSQTNRAHDPINGHSTMVLQSQSGTETSPVNQSPSNMKSVDTGPILGYLTEIENIYSIFRNLEKSNMMGEIGSIALLGSNVSQVLDLIRSKNDAE
jgi:hypothetical protein